MNKIERRKLIEVALGKREATLKIENANLVNVFSGEIYLANIYIYDEYVADVVEYERDTMKPAEKVIDIKGKYLAPGFIDSHLHIESSHLTPYHFAEVVIPKGTTTIIADPHEIGNALGEKGVDYMLEASKNLPMNQYFLIPSCVPSVVGLETTGAEFDADIIDKMLDKDRVLGLGEVMDFVGVINSDKRMEDIIDTAYQKNKFLQGHAPEVVGSDLSAYLCGGPVSCHEVRDGVHAKEKIRKGMIVDARESSLSKNITSIVENIKAGCKDATIEDVLQAAHLAQCDDIIQANGIDCHIGVGGANLSGGESQRINIARAFLKNAPILLLDEITANLDTHNQILINKAIDNLTQTHNKTIIMVAHKLTSIKYAHKVALVDEGKLIDFGTHTELLQRCEKYQNLWNMYADTQKWSIGARGQL